MNKELYEAMLIVDEAMAAAEAAEAADAAWEVRVREYCAQLAASPRPAQRVPAVQGLLTFGHQLSLRVISAVTDCLRLPEVMPSAGQVWAMSNTRSACPPAKPGYRLEVEGDGMTGLLEVILLEDDLLQLTLSAKDSIGEALVPFRFTLAAEGFGSHPDYTDCLCEQPSFSLTIAPADYRITLAREDGSDAVTIAFDRCAP